MRKKIALFDADVMLYRIGFAAEKAYKFSDEVEVLVVEELEIAKEQLKAMIEDIIDAVPWIESCRLVMSSKRNFRKEMIDPTYKEQRSSMKKPELLNELRDFMIDYYEPIIIDGLEADDVCGILATDENVLKHWDITIVSEDKDLKQIPGLLWNPRTQFMREIYPADAQKFHAFQTLTGDQVDNYPGCPGIGDVRAEKILADCPVDELWERVVETYKSKKLTEEDALKQARLAKILTSDLYTTKTKEVTLWNPPF